MNTHPKYVSEYRERTENIKPLSFSRMCHKCRLPKSQAGGYTRKPKHKFDKGEFYCEQCRKELGK